jgi:crotonobetainyl-CoA:carnitine CoA-transferase CaiB-like acyl-CoA transferase
MVLSAAEARAHPQTHERGVLSDGPDSLTRLAFPALLDGERPRAGDRVPALGEHTESVLAELGMEDVRKRPGIGRRFSVKRMLMRWLVR